MNQNNIVEHLLKQVLNAGLTEDCRASLRELIENSLRVFHMSTKIPWGEDERWLRSSRHAEKNPDTNQFGFVGPDLNTSRNRAHGDWSQNHDTLAREAGYANHHEVLKKPGNIRYMLGHDASGELRRKGRPIPTDFKLQSQISTSNHPDSLRQALNFVNKIHPSHQVTVDLHKYGKGNEPEHTTSMSGDRVEVSRALLDQLKSTNSSRQQPRLRLAARG